MADTAADQKAVMATLEAMAKATIDKDVAMLGRIYGDDVTYAHSSALTETKAQVLKNIQGPGVAEFMKFSDTTIRIYGDAAVAKGVVDFRNGAPGKMLDNHLNILWVSPAARKVLTAGKLSRDRRRGSDHRQARQYRPSKPAGHVAGGTACDSDLEGPSLASEERVCPDPAHRGARSHCPCSPTGRPRGSQDGLRQSAAKATVFF